MANLARLSDKDDTPALYGLNKYNANKDFTKAKAWGKNSFNNCFPVSLLCYMQSKNINPVYLSLNTNYDIVHKKIDANSVFGHSFDSDDIYFAFEYIFGENQKYVKGTLPRIDLVIRNNSDNISLRALEIKLTALPDNSTCNLTEEDYGCELVVRPNTIVHLTLQIISDYNEDRHKLSKVLQPLLQDNFDWENESNLSDRIHEIIQIIKQLLMNKVDEQIPMVIQPIWKTYGKSASLHENCLDVFVWSTYAFTKLLLVSIEQKSSIQFSRAKRSVWWMIKMLCDFTLAQKIDPHTVKIGFSKQTDKAFSLSGKRTHPYMTCSELSQPRIRKSEIRNIILGQGEQLLSPERRFDAILVNSPQLFM